ncbi:MAG: alcohol dehydrogenase catalytic domain-containing protein, partial [Halobacteria archaeon]
MVKKTEAAVLFEINQPLRVITLDIPPLKPGQVLVELAYSGICASQLLEVKGKRGKDAFLPHTLGHEGSGGVLEIGPGVNKVKPGDKVVSSWLKGNGSDVSSVSYQSGDGIINSGAISTFIRHTVTCENRVTPIPQEMPLREAALLGCAVPTGCGIIFNTAKMQAGDSVAVFGIGGVGLSSILAANLVKANPIIAIDIFDHKLEWARQGGATHLINAQKQDPLTEILNITEGKGVNY